jgi:uncharacterized protein (TIGR03435 family)
MTKALAVLLALTLGSMASAQAPVDRPSFEVASIKRNVAVSDRAYVRNEQGGRISVGNNTLRNIIRNAWRLQEFQIVGGADWINTERWDIVARAADNPPPEQLLVMLQNLLIDRFKLVVRREARESPIYALVLARPDGRLGPQAKVSSTDCAAVFAAVRAGNPPPRPPGGGPMCGTRMNFGRMSTNATTMLDLARNLSVAAGRSVVDKTGLTGFYDLELAWTPDSPPPVAGGDGPPPPPENGPSLFTAVQEQLGLKLDAQRGPVDTLVIESAQRPMED